MARPVEWARNHLCNPHLAAKLAHAGRRRPPPAAVLPGQCPGNTPPIQPQSDYPRPASPTGVRPPISKGIPGFLRYVSSQ